MTFTIEKVANMVFITSEDVIFNAWDETEVTERKIENAKKKIMKNLNGNATFINKL